jgi:quinol monooxygenase YgiN
MTGEPVVVRLSRARFAPEQHDAIAQRMQEAEGSLASAIRALPGCIDYFVSVDRASGTMVNVSVWDTLAHADAMRTLPEMLALREPFVALGAQFEPIVNYPTMWRVRSATR